MLLLGAHLSIAGGLHKALYRALDLECNCVQIFLRNQRQWRSAPLEASSVEQWKQARKEADDRIRFIIGHSSYLINLASDSAKIRQHSLGALEEELRRCRTLGIDRLALHPGSHRGQGVRQGIKLVAAGLDRALEAVAGVRILLENTTGAGHCLGSTIEELAQIIDRTKNPDRLGCCLDTCHLFAGGYPLSPGSAFDELMEKIDQSIGLERVGCLHLNDSVGPLGSGLDRHAHIGQGQIGLEAFGLLLKRGDLEDIPKVIETPKTAPDNDEMDKKNLSLLKQLAVRADIDIEDL